MKLHGIVFGLCAALPALALNAESWVASYGSDSNPCTPLLAVRYVPRRRNGDVSGRHRQGPGRR
jgi:hypothetical protein